MVSVCLPSDALSQHLPSYLGFSYLGGGVSLPGCSSKAQPLLLTLDEGYLLTAALPDLQRGMAPLSPPAPPQAPLLGREVAPPGRCPWPRARVGSSRRFLRFRSLALSAAAPDLGRGVAPLGRAQGASRDSLYLYNRPKHFLMNFMYNVNMLHKFFLSKMYKTAYLIADQWPVLRAPENLFRVRSLILARIKFCLFFSS